MGGAAVSGATFDEIMAANEGMTYTDAVNAWAEANPDLFVFEPHDCANTCGGYGAPTVGTTGSAWRDYMARAQALGKKQG